jgi:hypothetical protein
MMWYILGLFLAYMAGVFTLGMFRYYTSEDECANCRAAQRRVVSQLEDQIHGLKSTKGKLGQELQAMAFRNSGYNAR